MSKQKVQRQDSIRTEMESMLDDRGAYLAHLSAPKIWLAAFVG